MPEFELILRKEDGLSERYALSPEGLTLGRSPDNDITLVDRLASRHHARIWAEDETVLVEDLGSRNGVEVNGRRVQRGEANSGDVIRVGDSAFEVKRSGGSNLGRSVISAERAQEVQASIVSEGGGARLGVLYQAARLLGSIFDLDDLLNAILALIFDALPVRRGFILTRDAETSEAEIHATFSKEEGDQGPPLSHTLIQHVFDNRSAMLTTDAQDDSRFERAASIFGHQIHSAMCAPLMGREAIVGAIYVDSGTSHETFSRDDLELLASIALVVGVAVENARLYQESVEKARLAAIGEATAGLGHCVKNILTGIRGGSEFIDMALENEEFRYLKTGWPIMSRAIDRIENLVMNMLTFSKEREPERGVTDVGMLINDVAEAMRGRAEKSDVQVLFEKRDIGVIEVDATQIFRVIQNLLINAIEGCEDGGGKVELSCTYDADGCRFSVADSGVGMPREMMDHLPNAFLSTKGSVGTGLGLAVSYKIVEEHGGIIEVESEEGKGTRFNVFLPHPVKPGVPTERIKLS